MSNKESFSSRNERGRDQLEKVSSVRAGEKTEGMDDLTKIQGRITNFGRILVDDLQAQDPITRFRYETGNGEVETTGLSINRFMMVIKYNRDVLEYQYLARKLGLSPPKDSEIGVINQQNVNILSKIADFILISKNSEPQNFSGFERYSSATILEKSNLFEETRKIAKCKNHKEFIQVVGKINLESMPKFIPIVKMMTFIPFK